MKFFENGEVKRGTRLITALLLAFLSSCSSQPVSAPSVPAVSDTQQSSEEPPEVSASAESEHEEEQPALKQMEDGKLRVLYRSEDNYSLVFHGSEIVFRGKNPVNSFQLEDGRETFSVMVTDGDACSYALYHADGTLLLDGLSVAPSAVIGNWLFCTSNYWWYDEDSMQKGCVINLDTLEQMPLPGSSSSVRIGEEYIGVSSYGEEGCFSVYRLSDLSLVEEFPGCWGNEESDLPGFISLYHADRSFLYAPETGARYEGFQRSCGAGQALLETESGAYAVVSVSTGETLYTGPNRYEYYSDPLKVWFQDGNTFISAPCYAETEAVDYVSFSWQSEDYDLDVCRLDGSHDLLNQEGNILATFTPADGNIMSYIGYGCYTEQDRNWDQSGVILHHIDGSSNYLERYESVSWFQSTNQLLIGYYPVGNTYLMDLLDTEGNVVVEGLNDYYTYVSDPAGILFVRKGFSYGIMDMEGNWLWKESIFQTTADENGYYY